ncbi:hypothetical protein GWC77_27470 [Paraburkholderia sp. NMBU_R16]|uniref:hypothetical protein n=1 Tax=Paraburkholderia sp. NMBU_R16 TaxID=2698676 RepID=UPI001565A2E6|nr:hypothetical protein [Paraburkholderia sp. NMBU_R16]NRO99600.1 hypothetical protein [Paraburkholderia sp. NMBU_R16]
MSGYQRISPPVGGPDNVDGQFAYNRLGSLELVEHPFIASRSTRIDFINKVAAAINSFSPDLPVTVLSVGAGHLLTEQLINNQLSSGKKQSIKWRCIDPMYSATTNNARKSRREFGTSKTDFNAFSTSTAYLSKRRAGVSLAEDDRAGHVVVLLADPPSVLPSQRGRIPKNILRQGTLIKGKSLPDIEKCNTVLLCFHGNSQEGNIQSQGIKNSLASGNIAFTTTAIKCHVTSAGDYIFDACPSVQDKAGVLKELVQRHARKNPGKTPMENLVGAMDGIVDTINSSGQQTAMRAVYSDYDRSVQELVEQSARSAGAVVVAKFEDSQTTLTRIK